MDVNPTGFPTTHWSLVLAAGSVQSPTAREALASLCQAYWFPLYAHVRRRGHNADQAGDLTQGFFAELLARSTIQRAEPDRGRFRSFLLAALDFYLHHAHRDAQAQKRGGGREFVSWDAQDAEQRLSLEPQDERSPDREFDRRWALMVLEQARAVLRQEFSLTGKAELFEMLRPHLLGDVEGLTYAQIATQLNMTVVAVKVTVHRLRQRYSEVLRDQVARTLANPLDVQEEIQHLVEALTA